MKTEENRVDVQVGEVPIRHVHQNYVHKIREAIREPLAEFLGTALIVLFGDGSVMQVKLGKGDYGQYQSISWCWGIGVMMGVIVAGPVTGAHLNPGVTLALCIYRKFPWRKFPIYWLAQTLGAFAGAAVLYFNYYQAINDYEGSVGKRTSVGDTATAGFFFTQSQPYLSTGNKFLSEVITTALLLIGIFGITDPNNNILQNGLVPLFLFFLIFGLGAAFGLETGYAINFARDFGPRVFTSFVGYGNRVWTNQNYYSLIPIFAPFVGALIGGFIYDVLIFQGNSPVSLRRLDHMADEDD